MALTNAELRERIADHLRISAVDRALSAERAQKIDNAIEDCFATLREKKLLWWADNAIPQSCVNALKMYVAAHACASVGKAGQGYEGGEDFALKELSALKTTGTTETVRADYF
jgi:hypothetical protein